MPRSEAPLPQPPEHSINAQKFMDAIGSEAMPKFPKLQITAINMTQQQAWADDLIRGGRVEWEDGDEDLKVEATIDAWENRAMAKSQTAVAVCIRGDEEKIINMAAKFIKRLAYRNSGKGEAVIDDSGIENDTTADLMRATIGSNPRLEDLPQFKRKMDFFFKNRIR